MKVTHPKRILYVITKGNWGGAQRYVFDLAIAARDAGHTVQVASGAPGELIERLTDAGIDTVSLTRLQNDLEATSAWGAVEELLHTVRLFKPNVIHLNSSKAAFLGALAGRMAGVKRILFTAHGWAFNEDRPRWQKHFLWLVHYLTVLLSHTTICVSKAMRSDVRSMPFVQKKFRVIHNGVHEIELHSRDKARVRLAPTLHQSFWIGTIAELHPTKQLHVLIEAFATLADELPYIALVLIGEGSERQRLEKIIAEKGLEERVRLCGHVSEAGTYLSAFDLFVLPSRSEGLGYVLLEAGVASLPVVASSVGGIPEVIEDGISGTLVPSGDVPALTSALHTYLKETELRTAHGRTLHDRVDTEFSLKSMRDKTFALY